jgi:hypothetical protein
MRIYDRTSVHQFLGDLVVYRNLVPLDQRLPPLAETGPQVGLPEGIIPRKSAPDYARVIVHLLKRARALDAPDVPIERLIYLGDTQLNDGTAFVNICHAGGWAGLAFIGAEGDEPACVDTVEQERGTLYLSNRWAALSDFDRLLCGRDFPVDQRTAVVVDLDKTALGARGRNDHVVDRARIEAVRRTVGDLLGEGFDPEGFQAVYNRLNQPEFHPFTTDNQDYLAYICLILSSGLYRLEQLVASLRAGRLTNFEQFIFQVDDCAGKLPADLRRIHSNIRDLVQQGDPTPFKAFRYKEYLATVERMGWLDDSAPVAELLDKEIIITQEVREVALAWRERGALLFGLSDKPDEASIPTDDLAAQGYRPIHRTEAHAVGG